MQPEIIFHDYNAAKRYLIHNRKYADFLKEAKSNRPDDLIKYANADAAQINSFNWEIERSR